MKLDVLLAVMLSLLLIGCGSSGLAAPSAEIDLEIINESSNDLQNARALFGEHVCEWGWVVKTATKGYGFYPHPITAEMELQWAEEGRQRVEKLDLRRIYTPGKSGRLTFTIFDGRVEVRFREKNPNK